MKNPKSPKATSEKEHQNRPRSDEESLSPENIDIDSNRTESDGEDFNPGGRPRPRTEATGEDF